MNPNCFFIVYLTVFHLIQITKKRHIFILFSPQERIRMNLKNDDYINEIKLILFIQLFILLYIYIIGERQPDFICF